MTQFIFSMELGRKHYSRFRNLEIRVSTNVVTYMNESMVLCLNVQLLSHHVFGYSGVSEITSLRYMVWMNKMANHKLGSTPKLSVLPSTKETFIQHVYRATCKLTSGDVQSMLIQLISNLCIMD